MWGSEKNNYDDGGDGDEEGGVGDAAVGTPYHRESCSYTRYVCI